MGLNDYIDSPGKLTRLWADMRAMWPFLGLVMVGAIAAEPRALHLTKNMSGNIWAFLPWQFWGAFAFVVLVACFAWVHTVISRGVEESGPSVALANKFLKFTGSLSAQEQEYLGALVDGTHLATGTPTQMHIVDGISDLARKNRIVVQTDGHTKIWISDPYQSFAVEWFNGRAAVDKTSVHMPKAESTRTLSDAPRRLTDIQSKQIIQVLKRGQAGEISICNYLGALDADEFADDIAAAFREAGWQVARSSLSELRAHPPTGIAIELWGDDTWRPDPKMSRAQLEVLLKGAMDSAGLDIGMRDATFPWNRVHALMIVGRRPRSAH